MDCINTVSLELWRIGEAMFGKLLLSNCIRASVA